MPLWQKLKKIMRGSSLETKPDLLSTPEGRKKAQERLLGIGQDLEAIYSEEEKQDSLHAGILSETDEQIRMYKENIAKIDKLQAAIQASRKGLADYNKKLDSEAATLKAGETQAALLMKSLEKWEKDWAKHEATKPQDLQERMRLEDEKRKLTKQVEMLEKQQADWENNLNSTPESKRIAVPIPRSWENSRSPLLLTI